MSVHGSLSAGLRVVGVCSCVLCSCLFVCVMAVRLAWLVVCLLRVVD